MQCMQPSAILFKAPKELWCANYKGEFMMGNRSYCCPLTVTDFTTRFLIGCEGMDSTQEQYVFTVFERPHEAIGMKRR